MKRKVLVTILCLTITAICLCGCNSAEPVQSIEAVETEVVENKIAEVTEETEEIETVGVIETTEHGTSEPTNSEGLTVEEALDADNDYLDSVLEGIEGNEDEFTKLDKWAESQGADAYNGAWLIYYYGSAAGDKRSYAINQRTGEKMVAGPYSYFYGTSLNDDGAEPFWGTDKTYPGDTFPEFEENMTLAIEGLPAHTNGQ